MDLPATEHPHPGLRIYQPYLNPAQKAQIHQKAIAFDISFNTDANSREYELFKALHALQNGPGMEPSDFWGLLSSKFELKSPISFDSFYEKASEAHSAGADCYILNPMIGNAAIYANVMEHAQSGGHVSMGPIFPYLQSLGLPVQALQGAEHFFFCNYIVGNARFWGGYFSFCDAILAKMDEEAAKASDVGKVYSGGGQYFRDASASMRPFLIERLLGYFLQVATSQGLKFATYHPDETDFEWKFGPRLGPVLHALYETKQALVNNGDQAAGKIWMEARLPLVREPQLVWQLDDPPGWLATKRPVENRQEPAPPTATPRHPAAPKEIVATPTSLTPFAGGWEMHRNRHCIWIVTPPGYVHSHAFDEVAAALSGAFAELGGSAPVVRQFSEFAGRAPIIYGANLLDAAIIGNLPSDSVIVNLEQVSAESAWFSDSYVALLKAFPVIDYSPRNRANLVARGIDHAGLLEIGYHSSLKCIRPAKTKDFDVLFYGSQVDRRQKILSALQDAGLKVAHLFGAYGRERDEAIARSKLVINMHYYQSAVFEIVRVSYLLANGVCVLTEGDAEEPDLKPFAGGLAIEPYDRLVERCIALVNDDRERMTLGARGWDIMRRRTQSLMLKTLIGP
jgi:hypothetical protein